MYDVKNWLKVLNLTEDKVGNKILKIIQHPKCIKSPIFKTVAGGLDEEDGEHYDKPIRELQNNDSKLPLNIKKGKRLTIYMMSKFNDVIRGIGHNEELSNFKIDHIDAIVEKNQYRDDRLITKILLIVIILILEHIVKPNTFAKLDHAANLLRELKSL